MAISAPRLLSNSSFFVLDVAATFEAPKTCFASCDEEDCDHMNING